MNEEAQNKRRCPAMTDAGIEDPESKEGILFCAGNKTTESKCPYSVCVVFERDDIAAGRADAYADRVVFAKRLHNHGVSVIDIALILRKKLNTVKGYIRK